jgi:hypothetical protein
MACSIMRRHSDVGFENFHIIMLIPHPYPVPVHAVVAHGHLAIPDLAWVAPAPPLALANLTTIRGMFTLLMNQGYAPTLAHYLPHVGAAVGLTPADIISLENSILVDIGAVIAGGPPYNSVNLTHIAIGIQLWGGITGRSPFVRGGGFLINFPINIYSHIVDLIVSHPPADPVVGNWHAIVALRHHFHGLGVSFLTKHLSFWSRMSPHAIKFPILDRVIKNNFIHPHIPPKWSDYPDYLAEFNADLALLRARPGLAMISIHSIERQLFNFSLIGAPGWVR